MTQRVARLGRSDTSEERKTITLENLTPYVPAILSGARALRREAERATAAVRLTDERFAADDAERLEQLANYLDLRVWRKDGGP